VLTIQRPKYEEMNSDDDFGAKKKGKKKGNAKISYIPQAEQLRAGLHTLQEHNDYMFTSSFDASFGAGGFGGPVASSSQIGGYGLDDNFLDGLDIAADIGAELARELGEGWGAPSDHPVSECVPRNDLFYLSMIDIS
jgi:meiotic recombination protein REC8, fungi type